MISHINSHATEYHEAGHVIIIQALGMRVSEVWVGPSNTMEGKCTIDSSDSGSVTPANQLLLLVAGEASEELFLGNASLKSEAGIYHGPDQMKAREIAARILKGEHQWELAPELPDELKANLVKNRQPSHEEAALFEQGKIVNIRNMQKIDHVIRTSMEEAKVILKKNEAKVKIIACALVQERKLTGEQIEGLLS